VLIDEFTRRHRRIVRKIGKNRFVRAFHVFRDDNERAVIDVEIRGETSR